MRTSSSRDDAQHARSIMLATRSGTAFYSARIINAHLVTPRWMLRLIVADVCSGEELPEVEIISLLEEQIPRYRLRADTLTQFQGESRFFFFTQENGKREVKGKTCAWRKAKKCATLAAVGETLTFSFFLFPFSLAYFRIYLSITINELIIISTNPIGCQINLIVSTSIKLTTKICKHLEY